MRVLTVFAHPNPSWLTETIPDDMLDRMRLRENLLDEAVGR